MYSRELLPRVRYYCRGVRYYFRSVRYYYRGVRYYSRRVRYYYRRERYYCRGVGILFMYLRPAPSEFAGSGVANCGYGIRSRAKNSIPTRTRTYTRTRTPTVQNRSDGSGPTSSTNLPRTHICLRPYLPSTANTIRPVFVRPSVIETQYF